jgi:hypothetical protein
MRYAPGISPGFVKPRVILAFVFTGTEILSASEFFLFLPVEHNASDKNTTVLSA